MKQRQDSKGGSQYLFFVYKWQALCIVKLSYVNDPVDCDEEGKAIELKLNQPKSIEGKQRFNRYFQGLTIWNHIQHADCFRLTSKFVWPFLMVILLNCIKDKISLIRECKNNIFLSLKFVHCAWAMAPHLMIIPHLRIYPVLVHIFEKIG